MRSALSKFAIKTWLRSSRIISMRFGMRQNQSIGKLHIRRDFKSFVGFDLYEFHTKILCKFTISRSIAKHKRIFEIYISTLLEVFFHATCFWFATFTPLVGSMWAYH